MDEMRALQDKNKEEEEEVASLKKKLQWFMENQALLDRDAGRLKAATTEIQQLKEQVNDSFYTHTHGVNFHFNLTNPKK